MTTTNLPNNVPTTVPTTFVQCTSTYLCPRNHRTRVWIHLYDDNSIGGGSAWDYCSRCPKGPNIAQRTRMALDIAKQWLRAGLINQETHRRLTDSFVNRGGFITLRGPGDNYPRDL